MGIAMVEADDHKNISGMTNGKADAISRYKLESTLEADANIQSGHWMQYCCNYMNLMTAFKTVSAEIVAIFTQ